MARYTGRRTDTLHIRLEPELKSDLNQRAAAEHCSAGELVRRLLSTGLTAYRERPAHGQKSSRLRGEEER